MRMNGARPAGTGAGYARSSMARIKKQPKLQQRREDIEHGFNEASGRGLFARGGTRFHRRAERGLLGAMSLLLASARTSNEAATFTAALNLVRDLSEKARMNKGVAARNDAANAYLVERWREGGASEAGGPARPAWAPRRALQRGAARGMGHARVEAAHRRRAARCARQRVLRRDALERGGGRVHMGLQPDGPQRGREARLDAARQRCEGGFIVGAARW
jgi:hypothetical protein